MRCKSHPRLGAFSSLLAVEPKALCKSMSLFLLHLSIVGALHLSKVGGSVCYLVGVSGFNSVVHLANHLVVHSSKFAVHYFIQMMSKP